MRFLFITKILLLVAFVFTGINLFAEVDADFILSSFSDIEQVSDVFEYNLKPEFFNPGLQVASLVSLNLVGSNFNAEVELLNFDLNKQRTSSISKDFSETHALLHKKVKSVRKRKTFFKQEGNVLSSKYSYFKKQFLIIAEFNFNSAQLNGSANYLAELWELKCLEKALSANGDGETLSFLNSNKSLYKGNALMWLPFLFVIHPLK